MNPDFNVPPDVLEQRQKDQIAEADKALQDALQRAYTIASSLSNLSTADARLDAAIRLVESGMVKPMFKLG